MPNSELTVVVVNDSAHIVGGAAQVALMSAQILAQRGHSVVLFSAVLPVDPSLEQAGVRVVCTGQQEILGNPNRIAAAVQGIWNRKASTEMSALLLSLDPRKTVVHIHSWTKALSSSIVPAILDHGAGIVVTMHDYFLACPNGGFFDYVSKEICHREPLSPDCVMTNCDSRSYLQKLWRVARQQVQLSAGRLPSSVRHFIAISDFSRSIIEPFLPVGAKLYNISNPINVERASPADPSCNDSLIYVGRLASEKGPMLAAKAARLSGRKLRVVGDGYLRKQIEAEYPECQITGWLSQNEVQKQVERSRALVFPSLWYETHGLVVLEAAARGIPSVVADTSAARDSVIDGETGIWFRGGDADDLAIKLRALEDNALVNRLGRAAYDRFWASPSTPSKYADELEMCYAQVLGT